MNGLNGFRVYPVTLRMAIFVQIMGVLGVISLPFWFGLAFYLTFVVGMNMFLTAPLTALCTVFCMWRGAFRGISAIAEVEDDQMVRTVDGKMLRRGQLYYRQLYRTGIADFVNLSCSQITQRALCQGVVVGYKFKVVDEDKFAEKMAPLDCYTYDLVSELLNRCVSEIKFTGDQQLDNALLIDAIDQFQAQTLDVWGIAVRVAQITRHPTPIKYSMAKS